MPHVPPLQKLGPTVQPLHAGQRRRHLRALLERRSELMRTAVDALSHGAAREAREAESLQHAVERAIERRFPTVYKTELGDWCQAEIAREHPPGSLPDCPRCNTVQHDQHCQVHAPLPAAA